jgi:uncharacterized protein YbjT (DUF2867 family)
MDKRPILVTGATGYIGGRLVPLLLAEGYRVRAMGRSMAKLACRPWSHHERIERVEGDVLDADAMDRAADGCRAAFYLVHSMIAAKGKFAEADRTGARNMVRAAQQGGLSRIIYLGGLGEVTDRRLSHHLRSRHEVGEILSAGPVPATVLRAAMIIGSGSASFEMLRYLVERLPVMVTPKWVDSPVQPIAVGNVLNYLIGCLEPESVKGETFDIGGPEVLTYRDLIRIFAEEAGLSRRRIIGVPVLTPTLSAYWIHLVTPVPATIAMPLTEGLGVPVICQENRIRQIVPQELTGCREAIRIALDRVRQAQVDTCWMDAGNLIPPEWAACGDANWAGGTLMECGYRASIGAPPEQVWQPIRRIGGGTGWYYGNLLWAIRGWMDRLAGGIGLRRGRRHPTDLKVGDALDFWRVLEVDPPKKLRLLAEMKLPGEAMLEFTIDPQGPDRSRLTLHSRFLPRGLFGLVYWYGLYPFHQMIFSGMLRAVAKAVKRPITAGPERFTPKLHTACALPDRKP